ncbi:uncharacterized protein LOC125768328 isoform X2 [Anopheles funestus]|uniref:uncharacterized protein LOC125768328 isoform X2 n=1 Tax=Anopheles funestus TaxID=62324 RepID=UPI0020C615A4|nr:uncharacterized protein LOC125768328 isoform X2 [Anopheles funestus]
MSKRDIDHIHSQTPSESRINDESILTTSPASSLANNPNDPIERNILVEQDEELKRQHVTSMITKSIAHTTMHGELYNTYLAISIVLRQFKKKNQFIVATEVSEAGKFDDILYHHQSPNGTGTLCIQAKHKKTDGMFIKVKDLCAANGMYSVPTYFSSFLEIDPELTKGESESHKDEHKTQYAICTNAKLDKNVNATKIEPQEDDTLQFCDDIRATCYQLHRDIPELTECLKKSCKDVFKNDSDFDEKKDEFFSKFLLICNSYNHKELRVKVRNLLPEWCDEAQRELVIDNLVGLLNNNVYNKPRYYITLERIQQWFLDKDFNQNISVLRRLSEEHLESVHKKHPHIEVNPERLKEFKLYEVLKESGPGIYEFNSTLELTVYSRILLEALSLLQYETIFVDSAKYTEQQDMNDVLEDLLSYLRDVNHPTIKIITILGKPDYVSINELKELSDKYRQKIVVVEHISGSPQDDEISERIYVKDLSNEALQQLHLQNERMMFGTTTPLIGIVEENDDLSFLLNVLESCEPNEKLIDHHLNKINYEKIKYWYVHRRSEPHEPKKQTKTEGKEHFYVEQLSESAILAALDTNVEEPDLPGFQDGDSGKVFIFLNDAGFGKTTYFTWLAWRLASYDHSLYVIKFIALEFSTDFQRLSNVENLDETEIVRLLYRYIHLALFVSSINKHTIKETDGFREEADRCANLLTVSDGEIVLDETKTKRLSTIELFELRLFKEKFNEHKLVLILDGFDEIAPYFKDVVMKCFGRFSRLDGVRLLYLSSRPYGFEQELKTTFEDCRMYGLKPYSEKDKIISLHIFLVKKLYGYERYEESHRNNILRVLFHIIDNVLKDMVTVPLLLYMVQIALLPEIKSCVNENTQTMSNQMLNGKKHDILRVVERFIDHKLDILCFGKQGITDAGANTHTAQAGKTLFKKELNKQHKLLGMCVIFDAKDIEKLLSEKERKSVEDVIKKVNKGDEKSGIVLGVQGGLPQFLHRIFAEYFSACWLFENWKRFKSESIFHSKLIWSNSFSKIREFFDRLIIRESKGCDLHLALVNDSFNQVEEILFNNPSAVTVEDKFDRLPLHLVEYTGDIIMESILKKMPLDRINAKDKLFGWNALDYAFFRGNWDLIEMLFKSGLEPNIDNLIQQVCSNVIYSLFSMAYMYTNYFVDCMDQKDLADELSERVAKYLIEEKKIDMFADLLTSSVPENVIFDCSISMFRQLIEKSAAQKLGLSDRTQLLLLQLSLNKCRYECINYLVEQQPSLIFNINNVNVLYYCVRYAIKNNQIDLFKTLFSKFCREQKIDCIEEDSIVDDYEDKNDNDYEEFEIELPFKDSCCDVFARKDLEFNIEELLYVAITYGNTQMVSYILQKSKMVVTVELIIKFMRQPIEIKYINNHRKSIPTFKYLIKKAFDQYDINKKGMALFYLTIEWGCVYMLHSLITSGFDASDINRKNDSRFLVHRLRSSNEQITANIFVYLQQSNVDCFDSYNPRGASIFGNAIGCRSFTVAQALAQEKFRNLSLSEKENAVLELLDINLFHYEQEVIFDFIKSLLDRSLILGDFDIWHSVYSSIFNRIPIV